MNDQFERSIPLDTQLSTRRGYIGELGRERFLREIQLAALKHPNILPLYDSGEASGCMYFVMPVMAGQTLRHRLSTGSPMPVDEAVRIAMEVADASRPTRCRRAPREATRA